MYRSLSKLDEDSARADLALIAAMVSMIGKLVSSVTDAEASNGGLEDGDVRAGKVVIGGASVG